MTFILDETFWPEYVEAPSKFWIDYCGQLSERFATFSDMYSEDFLNTFKDSVFFESCKYAVDGKLLWYEWENCSKSCGGGVRMKIAEACIPEYASCAELNILREPCNTDECPEDIPIGVPPGDIIKSKTR